MRRRGALPVLAVVSILLGAARVEGGVEDDVRAAVERFVAAQNAHDLSAVREILVDSPQFLWITRGTAVWGRQAALARFETLYRGTWRLEPAITELRIALLSNEVAEIYMPITQLPQGAWDAFQRSMTIVAAAEPNAVIAPAMRKAVSAIDPLVPLFDVQTLSDVVSQSTANRRFNTQLLTFLGLTGLILAAIGIYGVIAFFVSQRTHEIGVRVALGASRPRVIRMVIRQAAVLALVGIAVGAVGAWWATKVFGTMLFQVGARDPVAFIAAAAALLIVALAASWFPARRAARVEPVKALAAAG